MSKVVLSNKIVCNFTASCVNFKNFFVFYVFITVVSGSY